MFHSKSVFKKYLVSYCIAIFIPVLLGVILYSSLYTTIRNTVEKQYENSLLQAQHTIDQHFEEIDNVTKQILLHPQIVQHFAMQRDSFAVYEGHAILSVYAFSNPLVKNIMLYNQHNDTLSDFNTTFLLSDFYGNAITIGKYSYKEFKDNILKSNNYKKLYSTQKVKYFDETNNDLLYISNYPLGMPKNVDGNIIVVIPAERIFQKFNFIVENGGHFYMLDKSNNLIMHSENAPQLTFLNNEPSLQGNKKFILHKTTSENGITYVSALPNSAVSSQMRTVTYSMIAVLFGTAVVLLWLIFFLAKRNSTPIKEILQSFDSDTDKSTGDFTSGINELDLISKNISKLMETNKLNRTELEQNLPFLVSVLAQNLLYGNILSNNDVINQANKLGITLGQEYIAIIISIPPSNTNLDTITAIKVLIKKSLGQSTALLSTDLSELDTGVIVISNGSSDTFTDVERIITEIGSEIYNHLSIRIRVAIGSSCSEPKDIFHSYYTAKDNLIHGIQTIHQNVEWFVERKTNAQSYYYPMDIEHRIVTAILNKRLDLAIDSVSLLKKENICNRLLNVDQTLQLFRNIKGTVYKCLNESALLPTQKQELENNLLALDSIYDLESGFARFTELLEQIDALNRSDNTETISSDIFQYMADNFTNPLLDRTMFANYFNVTSEYASSFFKNNTGYSFSEYLEKIRIGEACKLLAEKNLTINEIAEAVGYNSALSFRRAFKRLLGVSPSDYVKKL